jgi:SAM-dependent methyltransferase
MSNSPVFDAYSRYYDLLYRDKDYVAESNYINDVLKRYEITGANILEFGSGTGKHGRLLAERGYQVMGIERSEEMVAQALQKNGFSSQQGDIRSVQLGRTFDAVISLFHVVSYQVSNEDVRAVFSRAAEHLQPGGLFVFDVWYSPAVYAQQPEVRVKRLADESIDITRIAEPVIYPNDNKVDVNFTIFAHDTKTDACQVLKECHPMRHFSLPEVDLFAESAGFERLTAEEFLSGSKPGIDTWGVCFVLRKV